MSNRREAEKDEIDVIFERIASLQGAVIQLQGIVFELRSEHIEERVKTFDHYEKLVALAESMGRAQGD